MHVQGFALERFHPHAALKMSFLMIPCARPIPSPSPCILCLSIWQQGGSIFNAEGAELKFLKKAKVTFDESYAQGNGGHIANYGSLVFRNTAWFNNGLSEGSGGAIYSDGEMR